MKAKLLIVMVTGLAAAAMFVPRTAEAQPVSSKSAPAESPVGSECVVTVEMQAWMSTTPTPSQPSGFYPDQTLRGKIVELGPDWVVLKDGNYENWISRNRVVSIRVTR